MLDLIWNDTSRAYCNGTSRRDALRVGLLAPLGLALPSLLAAEKGSTPARTTRARSVILVYLGGGLSHHDSFDMKPEAPAEVRGKYAGIRSSVPGLDVCELLPKMAKVMNRVTLVRSQFHGNDHHETATNWVMSGRAGSAFGDYPAMGAVIAHRAGFSGLLPPYVAVPRNPSFTWELGRAAFLGGRCESFKAGDPNEAGYKVRDLAIPAPLTGDNLKRRLALREAIDDVARRVEGNDQLATYGEFQQRAASIVLSDEAQSAFDLAKETDVLRDAYGRTGFGQSCLMARRLVERGVRFVTVTFGGWDHHSKISSSLDKKLPEFDHGLGTLLHDLDGRGLLKETLVVCMGEFGRTPRLNKDAGRDHWGRAGSMIFAGAGVGRGKIVGATDKDGAEVTADPVRPADVAHTVFESLGIDPRGEIHTPDGRPMAILDEGALIRQLYS